jgi:hypothetical protein
MVMIYSSSWDQDLDHLNEDSHLALYVERAQHGHDYSHHVRENDRHANGHGYEYELYLLS